MHVQQVVPLEWWSVTRDCLCYSISVILLIIVLRDEKIYWYEALVLVLIYAFYILGKHLCELCPLMDTEFDTTDLDIMIQIFI